MDKVKGSYPLDKLLAYSKIVSVLNGYVALKEANLQTILDAVDTYGGSNFQADVPVAILAVLGPRSSGKSFLTNFLIQYFSFGEQGGWINEITRRSKNGELMVERGFSWQSVGSQNLFQPDSKCSSTMGVYLWPQPFLVKKSNGMEMVVWIMHLHAGNEEDGTTEDLQELEKFLIMACSRIMEIKWNNDDLRLLEHRRFISSQKESHPLDIPSLDALCKSAVFLVRTDSKKFKILSDDDAREALIETFEKSFEKKQLYDNLLAGFKHVNLAWIKDSSEGLHNDKGILDPTAMKLMIPVIKRIIETLTDETETEPKITHTAENAQLTLGNMNDFLTSTIKKLQEYSARKHEESKEDGKPTNCERTPNNSVPQFAIGENGTMDLSSTSLETKETNSLQQDDKDVNYGINTNTNGIASRAEGKSRELIQNFHKLSESTVITTLVDPRHTEANNMETTLQSQPCQENNDEEHSLHHPGEYQFHKSVRNSDTTSTLLHGKNDDFMETDEIVNSSELAEKPLIGNAVGNCETANKQEQDETMDVDDDSSLQQAVEGLTTGSKNNMKLDKIMSTEKIEPTTNQTEFAAVKETEKHSSKVEEATTLKSKESKHLAVEEGKAAKFAEQERIRKEKEERLRREEEEARKSMKENLLPVAMSQMQETFRPSVEYWIENNFKRSNIFEIGTIYSHVFKGVIEEYKDLAAQPKIWNEFCQSVDSQCKPECQTILDKISKPLESFNRVLKKQFDYHGYFTQEKLQQITESEFSKLELNPGDEFIFRMVQKASLKITEFYLNHNIFIIDIEKDLRSIVVSELTNVYHDQMKRYLMDAPYSPDRLKRIHWKLVDRVLEAFKKAFHLSTSADENIAADVDDFKTTLSNSFVTYKEKNEQKLMKLQLEISRIGQKMKSEYNRRAEEILKQHPDGLDLKTLSKLHSNIQLEVMKLLEMEIKQKIRPNEPLHSHKQALQSHIDGYWKTVLEVNRENLKKRQEREERQRERMEREKEAQRRLDKQRKDNESRIIASSDHSNQSNSNQVTPLKPTIMGPILQPLVFHIQSSRITMAMGIEGHVEVIKNESGEEQTPGVIVLTPENSFIYGSAALAIVESSSAFLSGGFHWSIADFFMSNDMSWSKIVKIDGQNRTITTEFLLGFLLGKLKRAAEFQMKGQCTTAVLAIPFWLSSAQRVKVKDAAKIAGFTKIYFVNETSAAAYNFILGDKRSLRTNEVLVISENLDRVDAFIYTYELDKKVTMAGHASIHDVEEKKKSGGIAKSLKRGFSYVINYVTSGALEHSEQDKAAHFVRSACKLAIEHAGKEAQRATKIDPAESLYICENQTKWAALLEKVSKDFCRRANDIKEDLAVVTGCVALSLTPNEIQNRVRDKLAYEVMRYSYNASFSSTVITKDALLPVNPRGFNTTLSNGIGRATFFQHVMGNNHSIGELNVGVKQSQVLVPRLEINYEAIVEFKYTNIGSNSGGYKNVLVAKEDVQWKTPNLSENQLKDQVALLCLILGPAAPLDDPALTKAKDNLLQKCLQMTEKMNDGQIKIKSQMVKEKVIEAITDAEAFGRHKNSSLTEISKRMEILERLCQKYETKQESVGS